MVLKYTQKLWDFYPKPNRLKKLLSSVDCLL